MKKRKTKKRILSVFLGGMLLFATPLQMFADDEPQTVNPAEETPAAATEAPVEAQEPVAAAETPVETAAPQPVVETPVQPATPEATVLPATPEPVVATPAPTPVATPEVQKTEEPVSTPAATATPETAEQEKKEAVETPAETSAPTPTPTEETKKEEKVEEEEKDAYQGTQKLNAKTSDGVKVNVSFEAGTFGEKELPELRVKDLSDKKALATAKKALPGQDVEEARSVDISFYVDGKEVQPVNGQEVSVKIDLPESLNPDGEKGEYNLIHEHNGKTEVVDSADVSATAASFQTTNFSTFTLTWNSDGYPRATLTLNYVDADRKEITKPNVIIRNLSDNDSISFEGTGTATQNPYIENNINFYRYYRTYILVNNTETEITKINFGRRVTYSGTTYTVNYLNKDQSVATDTTNNRSRAGITRNIYVEYRNILSGVHDASVYFLLTPTSNANSNATDQWNSNEIAVGLKDARVNLENAKFDTSDPKNLNKNVIRDQGGNGDLSQYIVSWPDGTTGSTWTITSNNTNGQWNAITQSVAKEYQKQLQEHHGQGATINASDIESITVTPYKISINNGSRDIGDSATETIHIDSTISVVSRTAYHYAFMVDFPDGSKYNDGSVKEGDKIIRATSSSRVPEAITTSDQPGNNEAPTTVTDNEGNTYTFDGWYKDNQYTTKAAFDYQPTTDEITASNGTIRFYARYVQTTKKINVNKTWSDNDNQDGHRPESVTVKLLAGGTDTGKSVTLTAGGNWTGTFEGLPIRNDDGNVIHYTVEENPVQGYEATVTGNENDGFTITNTHTPETVNISGHKIWADSHNQDGARPTSITVRLLKNGNEIDHQTVSANGSEDTWNYSFDHLPKYENGSAITYTVTEDAVENYSTDINPQSHDITNSYTPDETSVTVNKIWADNNNQDGIRPESVTVKLFADGQDTGKTVILSDVNNWTAEFENLAVNRDHGTKIAYTVAETDVNGYTSAVSGDATTGYTITNTHNPETKSVTVNKVWNDNNNQDGKRPGSVTVRLRANGIEVESRQLTADDNWSHTFTNLPKYAGGQEINYAVTEDAVEGYSADINGLTITNSYTPEKTSVSVIKEWDDNHNQDGIRPDQIVAELYANGDKTGRAVTLNAQNNWEDTFTNLDVYKDGQKINYTVQEATVPHGYQSDVSGNATEGFKITNAHQPETVNIQGTKTWDDNHNDHKNRPSSVTIRLYADGNPLEDHVQTINGNATADTWNYAFNGLPKYKDGHEIRYTVTEDHVTDYTSVVNDENYNITNTYTPDQTSVTVTKSWADNNDQDGKRPNGVTVALLENGRATGQSAILTEENGWTATFANLPIRKGEKEVTYSVQEEAVEGYEAVTTGDAVTGYLIENVHTPETVNIQGTKTWVDNQNKDNNRPSSVTIRLLANGEPLEDQVQTLTGDSSADAWNYEFNNLPKYADGKEIRYTVSEDAVANYTADINNDNYNITNTHAENQRSVNVTVRWEDHDNQDGIRPGTVTIRLLEDGNVTDKVLILSENEKWSGTFENLPIIKNGKEVSYSVQEDSIKGYSTHYAGTADEGFVVTNIHDPETVNIQGTKTWDDKDNQDGKRPTSITVRLHANGEPVQSAEVTGDNNVWNYAFNNLPKYENGEEIEYTVSEDEVDNYSVEYNGYHVTNSYTPGKTSVTVSKAWEDNDNQDGKRPNGVTVRLYADGKDTGKTVNLNEGNNWEAVFEELDLNRKGQRIDYTVKEDAVDGYESSVSGDVETGYVITNIHEAETVSVQGTKTWKGGTEKSRPESITVRLHANGEIVERKEVTANDGWKYTFTDLPKYENGTEILYTVTEDEVDNYSTKINGYDLTNTYEPGKTSVTASKAWEDNENQDGIRPETVTVRLYANGEKTDTSVNVTKADQWTATFQNLDLRDQDGKRITYTVKEENVPEGYASVVSGDAETGFVIANIHAPETVNIQGTKTWDDKDNQDGKRPTSITVRLHANGEAVQSAEVTGENNVWNYAFTDLPKYENGKEIEYTVSEDEVDNYSVKYNGYHLTNSYTPGKTSVTVSKAWEDNDNQDGKRPQDVTVRLYADGKDTGKTVNLNEGNNWEDSFEELDVNQKGQRIDYTVREDAVNGYESSVSGDAETGYVITNIHEAETVSVQGTKTWKGGTEKSRPDSITVRLHANGEVVDHKQVSAKDNWKYTFTDLPKYENGTEILYTVTEDEVDNYSTKINGYNLTNTYEPGKTSVTVSKAWEDKDNQDGIRPETVTVRLYANGEKTDRAIPVTETGKWEATFQDLDLKDKDGERITYTVKEENVPEGYESVVSGDAETGFVITNVHTPETIRISGSKTWKDLNNKNGRRPSTITVRLFANGDEVHVIQITGDPNADTWQYEIADVPKNADGKPITYTVTEDAVDNYTSEIKGFEIVNTDPDAKEEEPKKDDTPKPEKTDKDEGKKDDQNKETVKEQEPAPKSEKTENQKPVTTNTAKKSGNENNQRQSSVDTGDHFDQRKYGMFLLAGLILSLGAAVMLIRDRKES